MSRKIPQSVFGRAGRLLLSGAKIAASEAMGRLSGGDSELVSRPHVARMIEAGEHDAADTWALAALAGWEENVRRARVRNPAARG